MTNSQSDDMSSVEIDVLRLLCVACCERSIGLDRWLALVEPTMKSDASKMVMEHVSKFSKDTLKGDLRKLWVTVGDGDSRLELIKKIKMGNKAV